VRCEKARSHFSFVDLQYADYGAAAKVKQLESYNLINFSRPLTGMDITSGGTTSFHFQPKVAATDSHRRLYFSGMRTDIGDVSERSGVPKRAGGLSAASGKSSLASKRSDCISEELSVPKSECIPEEVPGANASSGLSTPSPLDRLSL
jgi:hypothetical protein